MINTLPPALIAGVDPWILAFSLVTVVFREDVPTGQARQRVTERLGLLAAGTPHRLDVHFHGLVHLLVVHVVNGLLLHSIPTL